MSLGLTVILLAVIGSSAAANCTDEDSIAFIEKTLDVDVLYLSRSKGGRCRAKVSGTER
jgi:hypothetical protein